MHNTQKIITFASSNNKNNKQMKLTEKEEDLIGMIRNYRKAQPDSKRNQELCIMDLLFELMND